MDDLKPGTDDTATALTSAAPDPALDLIRRFRAYYVEQGELGVGTRWLTVGYLADQMRQGTSWRSAEDFADAVTADLTASAARHPNAPVVGRDDWVAYKLRKEGITPALERLGQLARQP